MTDLSLLAATLGVSDRTLRRAAERGTIRCVRHGDRRRLPVAEVLYLERRWPLIHSLVHELRTLPNVRLAVLFGSIARGDEKELSDVDLFVRLSDSGLQARDQVLARLQTATGRRVQLVSIDEAKSVILGEALRDGRVLVDRDGGWAPLVARTRQVLADAAQGRVEIERDAFAGLVDLLGEATA